MPQGAKLSNLGEFGAANIFVPLNVGICQWWPLDELCAGLIVSELGAQLGVCCCKWSNGRQVGQRSACL